MQSQNIRRRMIEHKMALVAKKRADDRLNRKQKLNDAIENGDLSEMKDAHTINDEMQWECEDAVSSEDDEYGNYDGNPSILLTTSSDPSSNLKKFTKEIRHLIPNTERMNRGNTSIAELYEKCITLNKTDLVILEEVRGVPSVMIISHMPHGPTAELNLSKVITRHESDLEGKSKMSSEHPGFIIYGLNTVLGHRLRDIMMKLFPVAKVDSSHVIVIKEYQDTIVLKNVTRKSVKGKLTDLKDIGPSLEMNLNRIYRGPITAKKTADSEYIYRPYINTAGTKFYLSKPETETSDQNESEDDEES